MTAYIIDPSVSGSFSTNYSGPGTQATTAYNSAGVTNMQTISFTSPAGSNTFTINVGFKPRYVKVVNETDTIIWEKHEGMTAANALKINGTGPTVAVDTGSHVLFTADPTSTNYTVVLDATAVPASKLILITIWG